MSLACCHFILILAASCMHVLILCVAHQSTPQKKQPFIQVKKSHRQQSRNSYHCYLHPCAHSNLGLVLVKTTIAVAVRSFLLVKTFIPNSQATADLLRLFTFYHPDCIHSKVGQQVFWKETSGAFVEFVTVILKMSRACIS